MSNIKFIKSILENNDIRIIIILLLLSCIFFWKVLLNPGKIVFSEYFSDLISHKSPFEFFVHNNWQQYGRIPLWNPYIYSGHPFVGNPLPAMFFPLEWLYLVFQPDMIFGYVFLLYVFLSGLFTYGFMRVLNVGKWGSLLSAITFMFSGPMVIRTYSGNLDNLGIYALLPLTMLLLELAFKRKDKFYSALAGVSMGLQLMVGNTQVSIYAFFVMVTYFFLRSIFIIFGTGTAMKNFNIRKNVEESFWILPLLVIFLIIPFLVAAVQILPTFEFATQTLRSEGMSYEISTGYSFTPKQAITLFMPEFFGTFLDYSYWGDRNFWELVVYVGLVPLILSIVALISLFDRGSQKEYKIIFILLATFSFLFAIGKYFPLYEFFYKFVPTFNMFRKPSAMLFVASFSLSVLSGLGLNSITGAITGDTDDRKMSDRVTNNRTKKRLNLLVYVLSIALALSLAILAFTYLERDKILSFGKELLIEKYQEFTTSVHPLKYGIDFYMQKISTSYGHITSSIVIFSGILASTIMTLVLMLKRKISIKHFKIAIIVISLIDLWIFGMKYIDVKDPSEIFVERVPSSLFDRSEQFRVMDASSNLPQFVAMKYNIEIVRGYDPVQIKTYQDFINTLFGERPNSLLDVEPYTFSFNSSSPYIDRLSLLNVRYILADDTIESKDFVLKYNLTTPAYDQYTKMNMTKQVYVYENTNFLPRAYVVPNAKVIKNTSLMLEEIKNESFDPRSVVVLEEDIDAPKTNPGSFKKAEITYYSPDELHIEVNTTADGFLVLSQNWYPGWYAYDNGVEKKIYRADYTLTAVQLSPGEHEIRFEYDPASFRIGLAMTSITLVVLAGLLVYLIVRWFTQY